MGIVRAKSPVGNLKLIGSVKVLRRLYGTVIVPQQVITELTDPAAPHARTIRTGRPLLIDEAAGRIEASRRGILNTGTLGVLRERR